jgi:hypothetical protein
MDLDSLNDSMNIQYSKYAEDIIRNMKFDNSPKVQKIKEKIRLLAEKLELTDKGIRALNNTLLPMLIPAGVKASSRGVRFNSYINMLLTKEISKRWSNKVSITFETPYHGVNEIPDWTITFKDSNKRIIGYNQLDLWNGGAQINRGAKYILDDHFHKRLCSQNTYLICIVLRKYKAKKENKTTQIIRKGLQEKRLFWPKGFVNYLQKFLDG